MIITTDQAREKFVTLSPLLQDAMFSVENAEIIATLIEESDLSDDQASALPEVVGWVLLGFLDPENLSETLIKQFGVSEGVATTIQKILGDKIFSPLRQQITTINKSENAPRIIATTIPGSIPSAPPLPPQNLSGVGWSKTKLPPTPPQKQNAVGEFERIKSASSPTVPIPSSVPIPTPHPTIAPIPAPVMLRQEMPAASAMQKNADFHIAKSSETAQMQFSKEKEQIKIMPAVIEFNKNTTPTPPPSLDRTKTINYTEFKSSLSSTPVANSGERNITEITSVLKPPLIQTPASTPVLIPKPPAPPTPPMPPIIAKPISPSFTPAAPAISNTPAAATAPKVIVQDFLEQPPKQ